MPDQRANIANALGTFLRARRESISPTEIGLTATTGVRRTPGLRREELAAVAGISVDYYTRLERGREQSPSAAVVDALAAVLRLEPVEHDHLRRLAQMGGRLTPTKSPVHTDTVSPATEAMLDALRPYAAYATNHVGDILAATPAGMRLLSGITQSPANRRNIYRYIFLHPQSRALFDDWETQVRGLVGSLRALAATEPDDPALLSLVGELLVKSPDFARMWDQYDVRTRQAGSKVFHHPEVGDLRLRFQSMRIDGSAGQQFMIYTAEQGSPDKDALSLLDVLESANEPAKSAATAADGWPRK